MAAVSLSNFEGYLLRRFLKFIRVVVVVVLVRNQNCWAERRLRRTGGGQITQKFIRVSALLLSESEKNRSVEWIFGGLESPVDYLWLKALSKELERPSHGTAPAIRRMECTGQSITCCQWSWEEGMAAVDDIAEKWVVERMLR
jgi:hypothetical protein